MSKTIRLWQIGDLDRGAMPTKEAYDELVKALGNAKSSKDEFVDIIWGPDLKVTELPVGEVDDTVEYDIRELSLKYNKSKAENSVENTASKFHLQCHNPKCKGKYWHDPVEDIQKYDERITCLVCGCNGTSLLIPEEDSDAS